MIDRIRYCRTCRTSDWVRFRSAFSKVLVDHRKKGIDRQSSRSLLPTYTDGHMLRQRRRLIRQESTLLPGPESKVAEITERKLDTRTIENRGRSGVRRAGGVRAAHTREAVGTLNRERQMMLCLPELGVDC